MSASVVTAPSYSNVNALSRLYATARSLRAVDGGDTPRAVREALRALTGADRVHLGARASTERREERTPDEPELLEAVAIESASPELRVHHASGEAAAGTVEALLHARTPGSTLWTIAFGDGSSQGSVALLGFDTRREPDDDDRAALGTLCLVAGARLYASEARERVARERVEFIARLSHEVRTPLHGVIGFSVLCQREQLPAQVRDQIRYVQRSGEQLRDTLEGAVDLCRLDADEVTFERAPLSLEALAHAVVNDHRSEAARKSLSLSRSPIDGDARTVVGDRVRLQQMLGHLVANGLRFTERGGVVVGVSTRREGSRVHAVLSVTDTGPGVAEGDRERIFAPFEQGARFSTRSHGGLGLGLAIVRRLAERMGGSVALDSEPGRGSTFVVTMSFDGAPEIAPRTETRPALFATRTPTALRVLVAEDNPVNQMLAVAVLHREGHSVEVAANGRLAFDAVREAAFDVVLMDVQMPEMDGLEATARIRTLDAARGQHTPIIAMTAHGFADDRQRCLAAGMDDFVGKPIDWPALRAMLARWGGAPTPQAIAPTRAPTANCAPSRVCVDVASLRARVGGRGDVLARLVGAYREQYPAQVALLREALARRNAAEVRRVAHRLIGTVGCFSADIAAGEARRVELAAANGDIDEAATHVAALARELRALDDALTNIVQEVPHVIAG